MENTLENKSKFFAQYWGQNIMIWNEGNMSIPPQKVGISYMTKYGVLNRKLELKPISSITENEVNKIAEYYMYSAYNAKLKEDKIHFEFIHGDLQSSGSIYILSDYSLDFLRSLGYALPWMGLSVEDMITFGWIKLKNTES